jgi:unspecific monooxygenase
LRHELLTFLNDSKFNLALIGQLREDFTSQEVWRAFRQRFERIDALVKGEVAHRRAGSGEDLTGMLGLLLGATDEEGRGRSDDELRDELLTLVVAGYETTATALSWALYWIHRTGAVREALVSVLDRMGPRPAPKSVAENPYFDAVCKEVLRIAPVIPVVARQVQRPFEVAGIHVPPGVTVSPCIYLAHHREQAFPEPDAFRPERFLEGTPSPYEYLPFGGGARRCIGLGLAAFEVKVVLGTILSRFELELADAMPLRPVRRSVTVAPFGGVRMIVRRRIP